MSGAGKAAGRLEARQDAIDVIIDRIEVVTVTPGDCEIEVGSEGPG